MPKPKILFAGESAVMYTTHVKGVDSFTQYSYGEAARYILPKLKEKDIEVDYLPCHEVMAKFPLSVEELQPYDCVVTSDLGSNSLLFHPNVALDQDAQPAGGFASMCGGGFDDRRLYVARDREQARFTTQSWR
jgi:uncharacterized membrane protein